MLLTACGRSVKMSELQYKESDRTDIFYVYSEDKVFDGEAWSDDGRSFKISVDCGIMKRVDFFDEDGNLFYAFDFNEREELYFNEKGNEITKKQARDIYPDKYKHLKEVLLDEFNDILNQRTIESNRDEKPSVVEEDSEATKVAKEELSAAESEINKIHEEINAQFNKLITTRVNLEQANATLAKFESGTDEYKKAKKEESMLTNEIKEILDIINSKYAKYYGFLLTASQDTSLYGATRDKLKASIAVEILKMRKQEALDKIQKEYYGY